MGFKGKNSFALLFVNDNVSGLVQLLPLDSINCEYVCEYVTGSEGELQTGDSLHEYTSKYVWYVITSHAKIVIPHKLLSPYMHSSPPFLHSWS